MLRKPRSLVAGDTVALVAPSGVWDPDRLAAGRAILESWGLRTRGPHGDSPMRYFSGPDGARGRELDEAFRASDVAAVLCVRGGSGAARTLTEFDLDAVRGEPKIFVGFSDATLLLDRFVTRADLACFHGPMVAVDLPRISDDARERFRRFLFGEPEWFLGDTSACWRPGRAEGPLRGGCLAVLVTSLGTPYEIDTRDCVLFLEDVAEAPYAFDRMLTHMKHAGKFDGVKGVVFGPMESCDGGKGDGHLEEIVMDCLGGFDFPVAFGLDCGHGADNGVLPMGCRVALDAGGCSLSVLEEPLADGGLAADGATG